MFGVTARGAAVSAPQVSAKEKFQQMLGGLFEKAERAQSAENFMSVVQRAMGDGMALPVVRAEVEGFAVKKREVLLQQLTATPSLKSPLAPYFSMLDSMDDFLYKLGFYHELVSLNTAGEASAVECAGLMDAEICYPQFVTANCARIFQVVHPDPEQLVSAENIATFFEVFKRLYSFLQKSWRSASSSEDVRRTYKDAFLAMIQAGIKVECAKNTVKDKANLDRWGIHTLKKLVANLPVRDLMILTPAEVRGVVSDAALDAYQRCELETALNPICRKVFPKVEKALQAVVAISEARDLYHCDIAEVDERLEMITTIAQTDLESFRQQVSAEFCILIIRVATTLSGLTEKPASVIEIMVDQDARMAFQATIILHYKKSQVMEAAHTVFSAALNFDSKATGLKDTPERLRETIVLLGTATDERRGIDTYALTAAFYLHIQKLVNACGAKDSMPQADFEGFNLQQRLNYLLNRWQSLYCTPIQVDSVVGNSAGLMTGAQAGGGGGGAAAADTRVAVAPVLVAR
jgi:hypothetical protein